MSTKKPVVWNVVVPGAAWEARSEGLSFTITMCRVLDDHFDQRSPMWYIAVANWYERGGVLSSLSYYVPELECPFDQAKEHALYLGEVLTQIRSPHEH